ncbi:uncharacterized protein METZ01_LOCUS492256, partial [marine metagenome]
WAQTTDAEELLLEVGEHNAHASSLYTRMGFQWTGRRRTLPPPRSHIEEVEMAYRLHGRGGCQRR